MSKSAGGETVGELVCHQRPMKTDQASLLDEGVEQEGDIAIAKKNFARLTECREIEERQQAPRAIPGPGAEDRVHQRVAEHSGQLACARLIGAGEKTLAIQGMRPHPHGESQPFQRLAPVAQGLSLHRSGWGDDADQVAALQPGRFTQGHRSRHAEETFAVRCHPRLVLPFHQRAGHIERLEALTHLPHRFTGSH